MFRRVGRGAAETWEILLPEDGAKDLVSRFGEPLRNGNLDRSRSHEIGVLVAIDRGEESEIVLAVKDGLSESERQILDREIEELLGRCVYQIGRDDQKGWFRWDTLCVD